MTPSAVADHEEILFRNEDKRSGLKTIILFAKLKLQNSSFWKKLIIFVSIGDRKQSLERKHTPISGSGYSLNTSKSLTHSFKSWMPPSLTPSCRDI